MRPPIDLPPMTRPLRPSMFTTFDHVSRRAGSRSGGFRSPVTRLEAMYGYSNRTTRKPLLARPLAKKSMNGESVQAPAPTAMRQDRLLGAGDVFGSF
jgi:hypothetical protein